MGNQLQALLQFLISCLGLKGAQILFLLLQSPTPLLGFSILSSPIPLRTRGQRWLGHGERMIQRIRVGAQTSRIRMEVMLHKPVKARARARAGIIKAGVPFSRITRQNRIISAPLSTMEAKTSILTHPILILGPLSNHKRIRRMEKMMIHMGAICTVLQEETGGKEDSITDVASQVSCELYTTK